MSITYFIITAIRRKTRDPILYILYNYARTRLSSVEICRISTVHRVTDYTNIDFVKYRVRRTAR